MLEKAKLLGVVEVPKIRSNLKKKEGVEKRCLMI